MKRLIPLAGLAMGLFAPAMPAQASGDYGCEPSWKPASDSLNTCGNRAMLTPGNDTRVNLFFLLRGQPRPASGAVAYRVNEWDRRTLGRNFFYWKGLRKSFEPAFDETADQSEFAGSRCISLASGARDFGAALGRNTKLPAEERAKLAQARGLLVERCAGKTGAWPEGIASAPGREFLSYLQAAEAFYGENWDAARKAFGSLRDARDPWVAETAAYMLARVELNAAQAGSFDEWGAFIGPEKTDRAAISSAKTALAAYVKRYGESGLYTASARGLMRRALWLSGDIAGLAQEYERLLAAVPAAGSDTADLVQEVDNKLLTARQGREAVDSPMLLATIDLMQMRGEEDSGTPPITAEALASQKPRFAGREELFGFVSASHAFYVGKDMRRVLQLVPDDAKKPSYSPLAFSRQVLRGMALAALKDRNEAGFWRELLGGANGIYQRPLVELALAMNYERSGKLADVFAPGSPIGETLIREILMENVAGPELLRAQAKSTARPQHERDLALFTLLAKELGTGRYAAYLGDSAIVSTQSSIEEGLWALREQEKIPLGLFRAGKWSEDYPCPALAKTASALAANPRDVKARLCLGEFYRLNGFDDYRGFSAKPGSDELGGTPSLFTGKPATRGVIYADVIGEPKVAGPDKAYALYRAINCYAPSKINQCGGPDAPESQRKAWFQRLKSEFGTSQWAKKLRYYW
jgi:hypothetical protein